MADSNVLRLLVFRVADLLCAIEASLVRELLDVPPATRIPGTPAAVAGLINVRGDLVTLVDGSRLLGRERGTAERTLLLDVGRHLVGLIVDDVVDLVSIPLETLTRREALPGIDPALVRAVGRREGEAFVLLDLETLLDPILTT